MKEKTRPYRPTNRTEATAFDDNWCSRCRRDAAWREGDRGCDILRRVIAYNIGDPEYPTQFVEDDTGPRCDAFLLEDDPPVLWPRRPGRWSVGGRR